MRKPVALVCLAVILLAAFTPLAPIVVCAVLLAVVLFAPWPAFLPLRLETAGRDEQPVALLALVSFRAPPAIRF